MFLHCALLLPFWLLALALPRLGGGQAAAGFCLSFPVFFTRLGMALQYSYRASWKNNGLQNAHACISVRHALYQWAVASSFPIHRKPRVVVLYLHRSHARASLLIHVHVLIHAHVLSGAFFVLLQDQAKLLLQRQDGLCLFKRIIISSLNLQSVPKLWLVTWHALF